MKFSNVLFKIAFAETSRYFLQSYFEIDNWNKDQVLLEFLTKTKTDLKD